MMKINALCLEGANECGLLVAGAAIYATDSSINYLGLPQIVAPMKEGFDRVLSLDIGYYC